MKVTRLPVDPGPAAWNALLPPAPAAQMVEGNLTADWLIIGAGFAGLAAARRLTQLAPGDRIVVLEAARVGEGPAGRNSGVMIDLPHDLSSSDYGGAMASDAAQISANRHGIAFAAAMARDFDLPSEAFEPCGKVNAAATDAGHRHNLDFRAHLDRLGEPSTLYSSSDMKALTGTDYYQGGLFTPGAVILQPAMFVRGVADGLRADQVRIYETSPVKALARQGSNWVASTPQGQVTAPRVVLAVNGHLDSFGHLAGRLMHVFTYGAMTRRLNRDEVARLGGEGRWTLTPSDPMGTTVRRISGIGGDRIVVRNRFTFDPGMEVNEARLKHVARSHDRAFAARFPMLKGVAMAYRWGGRLCLSRNNVQVIGALDDGLFSACCQNGLGTAKGTFAGLCAAELAAERPSEHALEAARAAQPSRLPPGPVAGLGANALLRWKEWRAGKEL